MDAAKSIECLTWSDATYSLNEFIAKFGVPNLVCIKEGHYGINEACTLENDQVLMLHALRRKHNVMGEDAIGRPIAIPLQCENKLLRCPLSIYCNYDTINVSQLPCVYPDIKYFRVLENHWDEGLHYLEPESILEIENIDSRNSAVKFKDIDQPLPLDCSVVFEPLLDYWEYTLKSVVSLSGLPAMVRFLRTPKSNQEVDNEFENLVSNLGKVTLIHSAEPLTVVVATKMDTDSLRSAKTSVRCSQIPKDYSVNVSVATGLLKNDPAYLNIVREFNQTFLDNYDVKELDNLDKCQYLDRPNGNTRGVLGSVLVAKVHERNNNVPELPPRNPCDVRFSPVLPHKPMLRRARQITIRSHDQQSQKPETVDQHETCKDTNAKEKSTGREKYAYQEDYTDVYESMSDSSSDDEYEDIDYHEYHDISDHEYHHISDHEYHDISDHEYDDVYEHVTMTPQDHMITTSHDYVNMTPHKHVSVTPEDYVTMTLEEDQYCQMSGSVPQNEIDEVESSAQGAKLGCSKNRNETTRLENLACRISLNDPSAHLCALNEKSDSKSSTEITMLEPNSESSDKATRLKADDIKTSQNVCIPTDPTDLSSLTVEGVGRLLASFNMACYTETFEKEQIDGEILMELDETALKSLDLMSFHVRKLMKVIAGWRPKK